MTVLLNLRGGALLGVIFSISTIVLVLDEKGLFLIWRFGTETVMGRVVRLREDERGNWNLMVVWNRDIITKGKEITPMKVGHRRVIKKGQETAISHCPEHNLVNTSVQNTRASQATGEASKMCSTAI